MRLRPLLVCCVLLASAVRASADPAPNAVTDWASIVQPAIQNATAPRPPASRNRDGDDPPPDDPPPDDPPPEDPPPPPQLPNDPPAAQGMLVRIDWLELQGSLATALSLSQLALDTTETSPAIPSDPFYYCWDPNAPARAEAQAECYAQEGADRMLCLNDLAINFPNVQECGFTTGPVHSYLDFGPTAESLGARDIPFEGISPIHRDSWGPGGLTIGINYVRTRIQSGSLTVTIAPTYYVRPYPLANAFVSINVVSNQPTLLCSHSVLTCPDIELTNMKLRIRLLGIKTNPANPAQLTFDVARADFTFTRDLNNIPDWLVTPFLDVDEIITRNVERNVERALSLESSRAALNEALTKLVLNRAMFRNGTTRIRRFYNVWYESFGTLVVDYEPCGFAGCGNPTK